LYLQSFDQPVALQADLIRSSADFYGDLVIGFITCEPPQELFSRDDKVGFALVRPPFIGPSSSAPSSSLALE
jgi:hypothetical protein